jgi:tRNA splicing endonuclease
LEKRRTEYIHKYSSRDYKPSADKFIFISNKYQSVEMYPARSYESISDEELLQQSTSDSMMIQIDGCDYDVNRDNQYIEVRDNSCLMESVLNVFFGGRTEYIFETVPFTSIGSYGWDGRYKVRRFA